MYKGYVQVTCLFYSYKYISETFSHSGEVFILHHYNIKQMLHETAESAIQLALWC